jgi:outer membrane immunogenic protein
MDMRLLCLAAASTFLTALAAGPPALAQDEGNYWNGFYLGAVAGGAWGNTKARATITAGNGAVVIPPADARLLSTTEAHNDTHAGFTGGVEGGYNYMMGPWLFGLEADWTSLDLKNTSDRSLVSNVNPATTFRLDQNIKSNWMVSLRPRVGYATGPWLVYATMGVGWSELKYSAEFSDNRAVTDAITASSSSTKTGWVAGLGGGYALTPRWSLKGEWLYADFGHVGSAQVGQFVSVTPRDSVKTNMFRFGADYRF